MSKRDRRVAARTRAATPPAGSGAGKPPAPRQPAPPPGQPERGRAAGEGHPDADLRPVRRGGQAHGDPRGQPAGGDPGGELRQLTTLAGWRQFAGEIPAVPDLLPERSGRPWTTTSGPATTMTGSPTTPGCWSSRPRRSARSSPQGGGWPS